MSTLAIYIGSLLLTTMFLLRARKLRAPQDYHTPGRPRIREWPHSLLSTRARYDTLGDTVYSSFYYITVRFGPDSVFQLDSASMSPIRGFI